MNLRIVCCAALTFSLMAVAPPAPGWTTHSAYDFEIDVPADWIAFEVSDEAIDAKIKELGPTRPGLLRYLEEAKRNRAARFWAIDTSAPRSFPVSLFVMFAPQAPSLAEYEERLETQPGPDNEVVDRLTLGGDQALIVRFKAPGGIERLQAAIDHRGDRYTILITYLAEDAPNYGELFEPQDAENYRELFDSAIRSFTVLE